MSCQYCQEGIPHAPHTCGLTHQPPRLRGIHGKLVDHWWSFSACGAAPDEKCKYHYSVYCITHWNKEADDE